MSDSFPERLRSLRGTRTKAEFSRLLGIPAPMYQRYEEGQVPKANNLQVISRECNVTVDWLLGKTSEITVPIAAPCTPVDLRCAVHAPATATSHQAADRDLAAMQATLATLTGQVQTLAGQVQSLTGQVQTLTTLLGATLTHAKDG